MATIKVFTSNGVKEIKCFDNYDDVDYLSFEDDAADQDSEAADEED